METYNILITSAGRRCELLNCFRNDAEDLGLQAFIVAADLNPKQSAACMIADAREKVSRCTKSEYIDELIFICKKHDIKLLVPTIDTELKILARSRSRFEEIGVYLSVSDFQAVALSQDKYSTSKELSETGVKVPKSAMWSDFDLHLETWNFPLIFKPNSGSNSQGLKWAKSPEDIPQIDDGGEVLVQECLAGKEYTTNCYFDRLGKLRCCIPHERIEVRGGEVSKGTTRKSAQLESIAKKLESTQLGWRGANCFQTIEANGEHYLFEINARFGGGYPLAHHAGATFSKWLIQESLGLDLLIENEWSNNLTMLRYDTAIFSHD